MARERVRAVVIPGYLRKVVIFFMNESVIAGKRKREGKRENPVREKTWKGGTSESARQGRQMEFDVSI